jgi:hypothetical protein
VVRSRARGADAGGGTTRASTEGGGRGQGPAAFSARGAPLTLGVRDSSPAALRCSGGRPRLRAAVRIRAGRSESASTVHRAPLLALGEGRARAPRALGGAGCAFAARTLPVDSIGPRNRFRMAARGAARSRGAGLAPVRSRERRELPRPGRGANKFGGPAHLARRHPWAKGAGRRGAARIGRRHSVDLRAASDLAARASARAREAREDPSADVAAGRRSRALGLHGRGANRPEAGRSTLGSSRRGGRGALDGGAALRSSGGDGGVRCLAHPLRREAHALPAVDVRAALDRAGASRAGARRGRRALVGARSGEREREEVALACRLSPSEMEAAANVYRSAGSAGGACSVDALRQACRTVARRQTHRLATVISPSRAARDLVLPEQVLASVLDVARFSSVGRTR